ncbi:MAG: DUF1800 family protein [Chthoniobacteraceae bacterium]
MQFQIPQLRFALRPLRSLVAASLICLFGSPRSVHAILDQDGNGWSDIWEMAYGTGYDPLLDDDGDGRTNWEEHNDGTDPRDASSVRPTPTVIPGGGKRLRFAWPTVIGKTYQLQVSFNGSIWSGVGSPVVGTGENLEKIVESAETYLGSGPLLARYTGLDNNVSLDDVKAAVAAGTAPEFTGLLDRLETPQTAPNLDRYGELIRGWLLPPADGSYVFWIAGNAITEFSLSKNNSAKNLTLIAHSDSSTSFREWTRNDTQKSDAIELKAGKLYYFEAYQKETTGTDHVSVAWRGPGLNPDKEVILGGYVATSKETLAQALKRNGPPTYRVLVTDLDSDNDGLTDYEELTVGLDPFNAKTVSRTADLTTLLGMLSAQNTVTVGAETLRGYEAQQQAARFTFFRSGNINPITVHFTVNGTAQSGPDFAPLSGLVEFGTGQTSATVEVLPTFDGILEPTESLTATVTANAAYAVGSPENATVTFDDAADVVYVANLRPDGKQSGAYGTAALRVVGNKEFGTLAVSFGNLGSDQIGAEFFIVGTAGASTPVLMLPLGQISGQTWTFEPAGGASRAQILAALEQGKLGARIRSSRLPTGEISGVFVQNLAWQKMQKPPKPGRALKRARNDGEAVRFLTQATFGATNKDIKLVKKIGFPAWIVQQMKLPPTRHLAYVQARRTELLARSGGDDDGYQAPRQEAWWQSAMAAPDQLRQRMALALSEILVVSDEGTLEGSHEGLANYYDMLTKQAFGNFRDLLEDVTLSPIMGRYLSMVRNRKPDANSGSEPDENYAREIQQLFTIGLSRLNTDGSLLLNEDGLPIPTYTQYDIVGLAHVFTGWGYSYDTKNPPEDLNNFFRYGEKDEMNSMVFYANYHDSKAKRIVGGVEIPANLDGPQEMKLALDTLFKHPNVGPFIALRLIQRFVTSNPSRGYVYRVASAFNNNGRGVRGDLGATLKAVLLDPEARNPVFAETDSYGKLREPLLRVSAILRGLEAQPPVEGDPRFFLNLSSAMSYQAPLQSPTVFNFFQPGFVQPGQIAKAGLLSPEFQITTETSVINLTNLMNTIIFNGLSTREGASVKLNLDSYIALLQREESPPEVNQEEVIQSLDELFLGGRMSPALKQSIREAFAALPANFGTSDDRQRDRVRIALYITVSSPEFSVQK